MAEKKIVPQESGKKTVTRQTVTKAASKTTQKSVNSDKKIVVTEMDKSKATGLRVGAVILWVLALFCEIVAILNLFGKWYLPDLINWLPDNFLIYLIVFLVLDLIFVIIGSQLWKRANRYDPCSRKEKFRFFIQNQLGVIVAIVCFVPFIIVLFTQKDSKLNTKEKWIAAAVALVALVVAVFSSIDYHPISQEDAEFAALSLEQDQVYVTQFGHCFHLDTECQSLANTGTLIAIEITGDDDPDLSTAARKAQTQGYRLCKFCENKLNKQNETVNTEDVAIVPATFVPRFRLVPRGSLVG
ncbi:MAG: hypothetical protein ILO53_05480 [Clostridia bacterium]|nr:hypothetical protein [Clostridia bacterium]